MSKFTIKEPKDTIVPNGLYKGVFGGCQCEFEVPNLGTITVNTVEGVRGFGYQAIVAVVDNNAVVFLDDNIMLTK